MTSFQLAVLCFTLRMALGYMITRLFYGLILMIRFTFNRDKWQKKGTTVEAKLTRSEGKMERGDTNLGIYEFSFQGKSYKKNLNSRTTLPETCRLWFRKSPKAAAPMSSVGTEPGEKRTIALIVLIYAVVFTLHQFGR